MGFFSSPSPHPTLNENHLLGQNILGSWLWTEKKAYLYFREMEKFSLIFYLLFNNKSGKKG